MALARRLRIDPAEDAFVHAPDASAAERARRTGTAPAVDARARQEALALALAGSPEPDLERFPSWVRLMILVSAGGGAWVVTLGTGALFWRLAAR